MNKLNPIEIRIIGILFIVFSFLFNPLLIQRFFVPDHNIQSATKLFWIFFVEVVIFFSGIIFIFKSSKLSFVESVKRCVVILAGFLTTWVLLECISTVIAICLLPKHTLELRINPNYGLITKNLYETESDGNLGLVLKKNDSHEAVKAYKDGKIIYDVLYTTDALRRRVVGPQKTDAKKHIILFGCSFAYGEGLSNEETLQYYLEQRMPEYRAYNYAVHGYGPQQMLAILETGKLPQEVELSDGIGMYVFVEPNNIRRLIGSASTNWVYDFPYYTLDQNNQLIRKGSFSENRVALTGVYKFYNAVKQYSSLLKLMNVDFPVFLHDKDIYLAYKVIEKSKILYEQQFRGKFYVFIHPLTEYTKEVIALSALLKANHIPVLEYTLNDVTKTYRIVGDAHPNGALNQEVSAYLAPLLMRQ